MACRLLLVRRQIKRIQHLMESRTVQRLPVFASPIPDIQSRVVRAQFVQLRRRVFACLAPCVRFAAKMLNFGYGFTEFRGVIRLHQAQFFNDVHVFSRPVGMCMSCSRSRRPLAF